jgi:hypothetical protein
MLEVLRARIHSRAALSATALIGATTATLLSVSGLAAQPVPSGTSPVDNPEETAFLAETTTSMATMMAGMAVTPSGDTDADFVAQMIAHHQDALEPLASFTTNPAGSAIVNTLGPIRQIVRGEDMVQRRYLVIVSGTADQPGPPVQVQTPDEG